MAIKGKQKPQQHADHMNKLIEEWRSSGQKQEAFSISKGISPKTFSYWLRKKRKEEAVMGGFVPVKVGQGKVERSGGAFVRLRDPAGVEISFEHEVSSDYLRSLLGW